MPRNRATELRRSVLSRAMVELSNGSQSLTHKTELSVKCPGVKLNHLEAFNYAVLITHLLFSFISTIAEVIAVKSYTIDSIVPSANARFPKPIKDLINYDATKSFGRKTEPFETALTLDLLSARHLRESKCRSHEIDPILSDTIVRTLWYCVFACCLYALSLLLL